MPTVEELIKKHQNAQLAFTNGKLDEALEDYLFVEKHIQDDTDNLPIVHIEIGWTLYSLQRLEEAITYFERALGSSVLDASQRFDCQRLIGFSYMALRESEKALGFLNEALGQPVNDSLKRIIHFELGKFYFIEKMYREARNYLENALPLFTDEPEYLQTIRYYMGFIEFFKGERELARNYFNQIVEDSPDRKGRAPGFFGLAHLFYEDKEFPALLDACKKIVSLEPDFYDKETLAYFTCYSYVALQMWDELEPALQLLLQEYPDGRYRAAYPILEKASEERVRPEG